MPSEKIIFILRYLAQRIISNEHYIKKVLPTIENELERTKTYHEIKAQTRTFWHIYNLIRHRDVSLDGEDVSAYQFVTPGDLYAVTVENTIAEKTPPDLWIE